MASASARLVQIRDEPSDGRAQGCPSGRACRWLPATPTPRREPAEGPNSICDVSKHASATISQVEFPVPSTGKLRVVTTSIAVPGRTVTLPMATTIATW